MNPNDHRHLQAVFSGTRMQAEIIAGMLEANEINSMIKDETISRLTSPYMTAGGEVKVLVLPENKEKALELINDVPATIL